MDKELTQKIGDFVDANREKIISDLFELCSIPSAAGAPEEGAPFGKYPAEALKRSCEIAERYGIETTLRSEKGYAVCTYGDGKRSIAVLAHADVVPAGEGWLRTEAFSPVERTAGFTAGECLTTRRASSRAFIFSVRQRSWRCP